MATVTATSVIEVTTAGNAAFIEVDAPDQETAEAAAAEVAGGYREHRETYPVTEGWMVVWDVN